MTLTPRENAMLRRALDPATTASEAETASKELFKMLRERKVSSYDFVPADRSGPPPQRNSPPPPAPVPSAPEEHWRKVPRNDPRPQYYDFGTPPSPPPKPPRPQHFDSDVPSPVDHLIKPRKHRVLKATLFIVSASILILVSHNLILATGLAWYFTRLSTKGLQ
jgi:hypothetical protein